MASIRERIDADGKKTFQAQVRMKGYPPQTRTFGTKTDAKRWGQQTEVDIRSGMYIRQSQSTTRTVADLLDEYEKTVLPTKKQDADASRRTAAIHHVVEQRGVGLVVV